MNFSLPFRSHLSKACLAALVLSFASCKSSDDPQNSSRDSGSGEQVQPNPIGPTPPIPPTPPSEPVCTVDRFQQPTPPVSNKMDILFVMDNSQSMHRHWQAMARSIGKLIHALPAKQDIRFSVVLGTISKYPGVLFSAPNVPKVLDLKQMSEAQVVANLTKTFEYALRYENVDWQGAGEALFYSLFEAVTAKAKANQKLGFFRPDAALSLIFMSDDAEEGFPYPSKQVWGLPPKCNWGHHETMRKTHYVPKGITTDSTVAALRRLKGDMPLVASAFVNMTKEDIMVDNDMNARCIFDSPGFGYWDIVKRTKGLAYSLQQNRDQGMHLLGRMLKNRVDLLHDFKLSKPAEKVDPATIEAKVDSNPEAHTYSANTNTVHIEKSGGPGSVVAIRHCEPVPQHEWNLTDFSGEASQRSAVLTWNTREVATDGKVLYGISPDSLNDVVSDASIAHSHAVEVSGLTPNTTYYFQAVSTDEFGSEKRSHVISLHTRPDWLMGELKGQTSYTTATVSWSTLAYPTVGYVRWGTSPDQLNARTEDTPPLRDHMLGFTGLTPETTYYFQAVSRDDYGLEKYSEVKALRTLSDWAIVGFAGKLGRTNGVFGWQTPEEETEGALIYGLSPNSLNQVAHSVKGNSHQVSLTGLTPGTTYYFQAVAKGERREKRSEVIALRTLNDWFLANISSSSTENTISTSFTTNGYPTNGKIFWGLSADALTNEVDAGANSLSHEASISGLQPNTLYYLQVGATDDLGITKLSTVFSVRTKIVVDPLPVWSITGFEGSATVNTATLVWHTSQYPTTGKIIWGTSPNSLPNAVVDHTSKKDHSVDVDGLQPDTIYYFQAIAFDDKGQEQASSVIAVRTQSLPLPVWSIKEFTGTSTQTEVALTWVTAEYATKGKVLWGLTPTELSNSLVENSFAKQHALTVNNLTPNTIYFFQVVAEDDKGQEKSSAVISVRTQAIPDPLPNWEISDFAGVPAVNSAALQWTTSQYATVGKVRWGTSAGELSQETSWESTASTQHPITVSGLNGSTTYYFQAVSKDDRGQEKSSEVISLTTLTPAPAWQITGFDGTTTINQANLIWETPGTATRAVVRVGLSSDDLSFKAVDVPEYAVRHVIGVTGLAPNTTYFFQVTAFDKDGGSMKSGIISKKTKARK